MKYSLAELKQIRNNLALKSMVLFDKAYVCEDDEQRESLRAEAIEAEDEYEYVCSLIAKVDPIEIAWDKAFDKKYGVKGV